MSIMSDNLETATTMHKTDSDILENGIDMDVIHSEEAKEVISNETDTCESQNIQADNIQGNDNNLELKTNENTTNDTKLEQTVAKQSRELKSILALSKEANLDTNIGYKRKSIETTKQPEKAEIVTQRRSSSGSNSDSQQLTKRSMRSQNPEFVAKHQKFLSKLTSYDSESHSISDSEESKNLKEKDGSNKTKRRSSSLQDVGVGGATEEKKIRKTLKADSNMNKCKDTFCWRCHRDGIAVSCEACPRSYHPKCLKQNVTHPDHWMCPECVTILKAENTKQRSAAMKDMTLEHLCGLLKFALKRMMQVSGSEPFIHPVSEKEFPEYKNYVVQPMDLTQLEKSIKDNAYGSTHAFEADAKLLLHNSIIFNSYQSKLTSIAKSIMKICKQEMAEIENCASCYLNANTKKTTWFVEVCPKPHLLVWAKLKGFPYWPAKAMSTNSMGMVDVRFFGAHDRAWVPSKECFLYSQKDPNSNKQKRNDINECIKELEVHIENLKKIFDEFHYAPYRTPLEPDQETKQLQLFIPKYKPNVKITLKNSRKHEEKSAPENPDGSNKSQKPDSEQQPSSTQSKTETSKEKMVLNVIKSKEQSLKDLDKTMEGYGTEDEDSEPHIDKARRTKLLGNSKIDPENDSDSDQSSSYNKDNSNYQDEEDLDTQIPASIISNNRTTRGGKVRTRGGYANTTEYDAKRKLSSEELPDTPTLKRRNSDQSVKSDCSRISNISDKISRVDISENMEISLNDDTGNVSILENLPSDVSETSECSTENKRKPIVQLNIEANENAEFTISPQNKFRIADKLIKKLTESSKEAEATSSTDIAKVNSVKKQIFQDPASKMPENETNAIDENKFLLDENETKELTALETITDLSSDVEIFENTSSDVTKKTKDAAHADCKETNEQVGTNGDETSVQNESEGKKTKAGVNQNESLEISSSDEEGFRVFEKSSSDSLMDFDELVESTSINKVEEKQKDLTLTCHVDAKKQQEVDSSIPDPPLAKNPDTSSTDKTTASPSSLESFEEMDLAVLEETQIDEADIRNIIHSSLNQPETSEQSVCDASPSPGTTQQVTNSDKSQQKHKVLQVSIVKQYEAKKLINGNQAKTNNKRKRSTEDSETNTEEVDPLQQKLIKLSDVTHFKNKQSSPQTTTVSILQKELTSARSSQSSINDIGEKELEQPTNVLLKSLTSQVNINESDLATVEIKSEPSSDDDENYGSDTDYMEAKRKYLSALNISERLPEKPEKLHEIRTRSKTEEIIKFRVVDNISRTIDNVASNYSAEHDGEEITLKKLEKKKEIYIRPLSKMQAPKQRARKSFPSPATITIKNVYASTKREVPKITKALTPAVTLTNVSKITAAPTGALTNVVKAPDKPQTGQNTSMMLVTQPQPAVNNLTILPPNQPITYSMNMGNPVLTMVQHPVGSTLSSLLTTPSASLNLTPVVPVPTVDDQQETTESEESQNFIPQSSTSVKTSTATTVPTASVSGIISNVNSEPPVGSAVSNIPALAPLSTIQTLSSNIVINSAAYQNQINVGQSEQTDDMNLLNGIVPESISRAVSELMCRPPPKLKPRPPGPLSTHFDEGLPSTAGTVTGKINSLSHRLGDYFRGMLIEMLQELGSVEHPEAEITKLRLENEELRHKHAEEILEIKKNVSSILKDVQKSILEERSRLIEETRTACEAETIKRVEEAKAKQWCANCSKEAQFYCCWNTSYCDYPCQQKHWPKHMPKCTQNAQSAQLSQNSNNSPKQIGQQLVLRPATAPKAYTKTLIAKPAKVIVNRPGNPKGQLNFVRSSAANHITLVESTPGNYELVGNGPISVGGKLLANPSIIGKIKSGNVITVTSPSSTSGTSGTTTSTQKATIVFATNKQSTQAVPVSKTVSISDGESD